MPGIFIKCQNHGVGRYEVSGRALKGRIPTHSLIGIFWQKKCLFYCIRDTQYLHDPSVLDDKLGIYVYPRIENYFKIMFWGTFDKFLMQNPANTYRQNISVLCS